VDLKAVDKFVSFSSRVSKEAASYVCVYLCVSEDLLIQEVG